MSLYAALVAGLGFVVLLGGATSYLVQAQKSFKKRRNAASPLITVDEMKITRDGEDFLVDYVMKNKGPDALRDIQAGAVGEGNGVISGGTQVLGPCEELHVQVRSEEKGLWTPLVFATDASGQRWEMRFEVLFEGQSAKPVRGKFGSWTGG